MAKKTTTRTTRTKKAPSKRASSGKLTADATKSVISAKFRERYADGTCGDDVAAKLAEHTRGADGKPDAAKLQKLAEANGCWQAGYASLNVGMQRMNVGNRLRKLARDGATIKWGR